MKIHFKNYLLILTIFFNIGLYSCDETNIDRPPLDYPDHSYSFFVAGHAYGNPNHPQYGFHPPLVNAIPKINNYSKMTLGVLTGDVVVSPTAEYWDSALVDIDKFDVPIHIAPGNHDRSALFLEHFHNYYYAFKNEEDLFIILTPTRWNIEGEQKAFLEQQIAENYQTSKNIFIFCHELIWWSPENQFKNVEINYRPHYPGSTNYWEEISPMLDSIPNNVVIFAGDLGCTTKVSPYMYYKYDNITLIGSGMGGEKEDNIVIVEVSDSSTVNFRLIGLNNEEFTDMAKLEDYVLP